MMKTNIAIILDRSGSMWDIREQAVQGYNEQVGTLQENAKTQDINVSLVSFNDEVFEHYWLQPADKCERACQGDYVADGGNALWDAIGYTLDKLQETTDQNDPDTAFLVVIISDGQENSSRHVRAQEILQKITTLQDTKKWTFTFMGCSESYLRQLAGQTGISVQNMAVWSNATKGAAAAGYRQSNHKMTRYLRSRASGQSMSCDYYSESAGTVADFSEDDDADLPTPPISSGTVHCCSLGFAANTTDNPVPVDDGGVKIFSTAKPVTWKM
jgi:hypothetical protein